MSQNIRGRTYVRTLQLSENNEPLRVPVRGFPRRYRTRRALLSEGYRAFVFALGVVLAGSLRVLFAEDSGRPKA